MAVPAGAPELEAIDEVARGGMGVVYRAWDPRLGRAVALKRARADVPGAEARLRREARVGAALDHPNLVPVLGLGEDADGLWMTTPWVEGLPLDKLPAHAKSHPAKSAHERRGLRAARALLQAARGVAAAHERGVVHRDLKPGNVLVAAGSGGDRVRVIDWGLARTPGDVSEPSLTRTGHHVGTPGYIAPELLLGEEPSPASDVWSLGAMLLEALQRGAEGPAAAGRSGELTRRVLSGEQVSAEGPLGAVAARALGSDPASRFPTAGAFAEALSAALEASASAGEPSRRLGPGRIAAGAALVALGGLGGASLWREPPPERDPVPLVEALAWEHVRAGRLRDAAALAQDWLDVPSLANASDTPVPIVDPAPCDALSARGDRLLCVSGDRLEVRDVEGTVVQRGQAGTAARLLDDGALWVSRGEVSWWSHAEGAHETLNRGRVEGAEANGSALLQWGAGVLLLSKVPEEPVTHRLDTVAVSAAHVVAAVPWRDGFLVWTGARGLARTRYVSAEGETREVAAVQHDGSAVAAWRTPDGLAVLWDRGPLQLLDEDLSERARWYLPPGASVTAGAWSPDALVVATRTHGVLQFDAQGGLQAQLTEALVDDVAIHGTSAVWRVGTEVRRVPLTDAPAVGWFAERPLTAGWASADGSLALGDSEGSVQLRGPGGLQQWATYPDTVRAVWREGDALWSWTIGAPEAQALLPGGRRTSLPFPIARRVVPFRGGVASTGWGVGLVVADASGSADPRWPAAREDIVDLATGPLSQDDARTEAVWQLRADGQIARFLPESGFKDVTRMPGAMRLAVAAEGLFVAGREAALLQEGEVVWTRTLAAPARAALAVRGWCLVGEADGTVERFRCADGQPAPALRLHDDQVDALHAAGESVLSVGRDGRAWRWPLPSGQ